MFKKITRWINHNRLASLVRKNGYAVAWMKNAEGIQELAFIRGTHIGNVKVRYHTDSFRYRLIRDGLPYPSFGEIGLELEDEFEIAPLVFQRGECGESQHYISTMAREREKECGEMVYLFFIDQTNKEWYITRASNHQQASKGCPRSFILFSNPGDGDSQERMTIYTNMIPHMRGQWVYDKKISKDLAGEHKEPSLTVDGKILLGDANRANNVNSSNRREDVLAIAMLARLSQHLNISQPEYEEVREQKEDFVTWYLKGRIRDYIRKHPKVKQITWVGVEDDHWLKTRLLQLETQLRQEKDKT